MVKPRSTTQGQEDRDDLPVEIPMTDLGWSEDPAEAEAEDRGARDPHAAGTPGGGTAHGGLAGTNVGDGSPDNADLEDALGSGIHDTADEERSGPPYAGPAGGAVGGTPAEKRARGGRHPAHREERASHRGDTTIGAPSPD